VGTRPFRLKVSISSLPFAFIIIQYRSVYFRSLDAQKILPSSETLKGAMGLISNNQRHLPQSYLKFDILAKLANPRYI
jgi:hypothetical protein